jgi:hypothetical protein
MGGGAEIEAEIVLEVDTRNPGSSVVSRIAKLALSVAAALNVTPSHTLCLRFRAF